MEVSIEYLNIIQPRQPVLSVEIDLYTTENDNHYEIIENSLIEYAIKNPTKKISVYRERSGSVNFIDIGMSEFFIFAKSEHLAKNVNEILLKRKIRSKLDYILPEASYISYHIENGNVLRRADKIIFNLLDKHKERI